MINNIEFIGLTAAILTTIAFVPQVIKVIRSKKTNNLSLTTYVIFTIGVSLWLVYGLFKNSISMILGNGITRKSAGCNFIADLLVGNLVGAGLGVGFFYALWSKQENRHLLFTSDLGSNRVSCSRPSKQTFKCAVYKNGQLIKNL